MDTPRDVRGFEVKCYTEARNWNLAGNNIPVFSIEDAIKFPDLVHGVKTEAARGFRKRPRPTTRSGFSSACCLSGRTW